MQQFIIPVNNEALSRALVASVGEESTQLILKAYKAIDEAMVFGHQQGVAEEKALAKSQADHILKEAVEKHDAIFHEGYRNGVSDTKAQDQAEYEDDLGQDAFDDGYIEGVADARTRPEQADDYIAYLCRLDEAAYETAGIEHTEAYEGDSGDETDCPF